MKSFTKLYIPIALETLCHMLAGMVDTIMLSTVGDNAVGAVGTANTYINVFIIMFHVVSSGMIAVMTQYIGAKRIGVAYQARQLGTIFNAVIGIVLSIFLYVFSGTILEVVGVAPLLMDYATIYLKIVGGCCFLNALIPIFSSYLRAFGYTKQPLIATLIANAVNLCLNAVFLFGLNAGVAGVAAATVFSRILNLGIVIVASKILVKAKEDSERLKKYGGFCTDYQGRIAFSAGNCFVQCRNDIDNSFSEPDGRIWFSCDSKGVCCADCKLFVLCRGGIGTGKCHYDRLAHWRGGL